MRRTCWIAILSLPLFAQDPSAGNGVNFYSLEKEGALGRHLAAEVARSTTPLSSTSVRDYLNELGQRVAVKVSGPAIPYSFQMLAGGVDNVTHEPLALPGGYIFVPAALLLAVQDEAEFAGMLAHGIAHIAARHYTRQATRSQLTNMSTVPLVYMGGWTGHGMNQDGAAMPLSLLRIQRENELEADRLATQAMAGAGFDPAALARYIGRVQPEAGDRPWAFSPLPTRDQRLRALQDAARALPAPAPTPSEAFQSIQEQVRRLIPAPSERRQPTLPRLPR